MPTNREKKLVDVEQVGRLELLYQMAANEPSRRVVLLLAGAALLGLTKGRKGEYIHRRDTNRQ